MRTGTLFVIAGPSGVGKGTVVREVLSRIPRGLVLSVSATTRPRRSIEVDQVDYLFVDEDEFDRMIRDGELLEWAPIVGHRSGTPRGWVEQQRRDGNDVLLEIDVKGAEQIRALVPDAVLIFLEPPSPEELERRLRGRGTESEERIMIRLQTAGWELDQRDWFDEVVVNDDLEHASSQVAAIIEASHDEASSAVDEDPTEDVPS